MIGGSVNHRSLLRAADLCPFHPNISLNDSHAVWNGHVCFTSSPYASIWIHFPSSVLCE